MIFDVNCESGFSRMKQSHYYYNHKSTKTQRTLIPLWTALRRRVTRPMVGTGCVTYKFLYKQPYADVGLFNQQWDVFFSCPSGRMPACCLKPVRFAGWEDGWGFLIINYLILISRIFKHLLPYCAIIASFACTIKIE